MIRRSPAWLGVLAFVLVLAVAVGVCAALPSHEIAISPAAPVPLDKRIRIGGTVAVPLHGRLALVGVSEQQVSLLQSWIYRLDRRITLQRSTGTDPQSSASVSAGNDEIVQSKQVAAAVALKLLGQDVTFSGDGVQVSGVLAGSPADGHLRVADLITSVDGRPVDTADEVSSTIGAKPPGTVVKLGIRRDQVPQVVTLRTVKPTGGSSHRSQIGIGVTTENLKIHLPEQVSISTSRVIGPSAGLSFALGVYDSVSPRDLLGGRYVVATGELQLDGTVVPIGGVRQKAIAAQDAGYDLMLVPTANLADAEAGVRAVCKEDGDTACLQVRSVTSVSNAVQVLEHLGATALHRA